MGPLAFPNPSPPLQVCPLDMGTVQQECDPGEEHSYLELRSRWPCTINTRLVSEKQCTKE